MTIQEPLDEALVGELRAAVSAELSERVAATLRETGRRLDHADQESLACELINSHFERRTQASLAPDDGLGPDGEAQVRHAVLDRIFKLGRVQALIDNPNLKNIFINGCDRVFVEYLDGTKERAPAVADSDAELIELLQEAARRYGLTEREFNPAHPSLSLQLPDGSRLFAVAWVCARPCVAIRRHPLLEVNLDGLGERQMVDLGLVAFVRAAVKARLRIVIAGSTGVGKTTLQRAMLAEISPDERVFSIEHQLELGLDQFEDRHPDCVALEARDHNLEGIGAVSQADCLRWILRMGPTRILLNEVLGDEVVVMLGAMSKGHDGAITTVHSDSSATVFNQLALYAIQAPERLPMEATMMLAAAAIDLVIFLAQRGDQPFVSSIRYVRGYDGLQVVTDEIYRPGPDGRAVPDTLPAPLRQRLEDAGYDPAWHARPEGWWR